MLFRSRGVKLPQLQRALAQRYQRSEPGLSRFGLRRIHASFPTAAFTAALERLVGEPRDGLRDELREVAILQTFAPNLDQYRTLLSRCLEVGARLRILLAWPYSRAADLREEVLKRYADESLSDDFAIQGCVIANLELLEGILRVTQIGRAHV